MTSKPQTTDFIELPEPPQRAALVDIFKTILPAIKIVSHEQLAGTVERMLLKRGFKIVAEPLTEKLERLDNVRT